MNRLLPILTSFLLTLIGFSAEGQVTLTPYCTGLSVPVDIRNCGDSRLFIVEQAGKIRIIDSNGVLSPTPFLNITSTVLYGGERGLLGLAFAPDYLTSGYFYVDYTARPSGYTRISRFRVSSTDPNVADPTSEEILLTIYQPYSNHNGGCLAFSPENGYLYIGMGDGGSAGDPGNRAQNTDSLLGKLLRLKVTSGVPGYQIPEGNPFAQDTSLGRPEVWAIGMRNPWRFSFDPVFHDLWIGDVGQGAWEEVDVESATVTQGRNYGWRCYEGAHTYNATGCAPASNFTLPVYEYAHSGGNCSITGGYVYRGANYADIYGKYFFTDYCVNQMRTLTKNGTSYTLNNLGSLATGSYVAFGVDQWGELYASDVVNGRIMKFNSTLCNPVAAINGGGTDSIFQCSNPEFHLFTPKGKNFTYEWTISGLPLLHNADTLTVYGDGEVVLHVTDSSGCMAYDTVYVKNLPEPVIDFSGLDSAYCIFNGPVILAPSPIGGLFNGAGMAGLTFDPSVADTGMHVISYTYTDTYGCSATVSHSTTVDYCLDASPEIVLKEIRIYPNPGDGRITLSLPANRQQSVLLTLSDLTGKECFREELVTGNGSSYHQLDFTAIQNGMYLMNVRLSTVGEKTIKVILQR